MNWLTQLIRTFIIIMIVLDLLELSAPGVHDTLILVSSIPLIKKGTKKIYPLVWDNYQVNISNEYVLSDELIEKTIDDFWKTKVSKINTNQHIIVLFRIGTSDNLFYTIGQLQSLNQTDKTYYIEYIKNILSIKSDEYKNYILKNIVFSFGVREGLDKTDKITLKSLEKTIKHQYYKHYKLPIAFDPLKYGKIITSFNNTYWVQITPLTTAIINHTSTINQVQIIKDGNIIIKFNDQLLEDNTILRTIGKNIYRYDLNGNLLLLEVNKPTKFISKLSPDLKRDKRIITMDIETRVIKNQLTPYLISWYDGIISNSFFLLDYDSPDKMLQNAILSLCNKKYNNYKVYFHNFALFDGIFILKNLVELGFCNPIIHNGKLVCVHFKFGNKINLHFRDSFLILLSSLDKLSKSFLINNPKIIFPYKFVDQTDLNYAGECPAIDFFDTISVEDYNIYKSENKYWNLKRKAIQYCERDCISLREILIKFSDLIWDKFHININDYPTLTGLSFAIFRTHYLKKNTIPMISGEIFKNIKNSYTGGSTDMFIPTNDTNEKIYGYDVNSLYPSIMANKPMPGGSITYFEGDIRKYQKDAFGFFYCKITTPNDLNHPILQTHVKTKSGIRTISALGSYENMIFSEEIDNTIKLGYHFEILWGYKFEKVNIFKEFITDLYRIRLEYDKSNPINYVAKIIMNSLYGRFGMDDNFDRISIITKTKATSFISTKINSIIDILDINENKVLIKYKLDDSLKTLDNFLTTHNISIAIASAITAYSRIEMSKFKNNPNLKLFYTDTDSIYTNLDPDKINKLYPGCVNSLELGKLKLETVSNKAIFIAPKSYCLQQLDGKTIFKIKGLITDVSISIEDFEHLLEKGSVISKNQTKLFKNLIKGRIEVLEQSYTLQQTDNKRQLIYDQNNKLISTKPFVIDSKKLIQ